MSEEKNKDKKNIKKIIGRLKSFNIIMNKFFNYNLRMYTVVFSYTYINSFLI